jgi:hypothetical protein
MAATVQSAPLDTSEVAILVRLFEGRNGTLSRQLARRILTITFMEADQARMEELAHRNKQGRLTAQERQELGNYVNVGDWLCILHSKARQALKQPKRRECTLEPTVRT